MIRHVTFIIHHQIAVTNLYIYIKFYVERKKMKLYIKSGQ